MFEEREKQIVISSKGEEINSGKFVMTKQTLEGTLEVLASKWLKKAYVFEIKR